MGSCLYSGVIEDFLTGNHNSLVLPSSISKTDTELLVEHVSKILYNSQDKPIIDKCKNLITIFKDSIAEIK